MNKNINKDFFEKIQQRAERSLVVEEVNFNTQLYKEVIIYLKKQRYIKFLEINKILANNFISDYPF